MKRHHFYSRTHCEKMSTATTGFKDNKEASESNEVKNALLNLKAQHGQEKNRSEKMPQDIGTLHYDGKKTHLKPSWGQLSSLVT